MPGASLQLFDLFSLDLHNGIHHLDKPVAMEPHRQGCTLPSGVPQLTSLPAAAQAQALSFAADKSRVEKGDTSLGALPQ